MLFEAQRNSWYFDLFSIYIYQSFMLAAISRTCSSRSFLRSTAPARVHHTTRTATRANMSGATWTPLPRSSPAARNFTTLPPAHSNTPMCMPRFPIRPAAATHVPCRRSVCRSEGALRRSWPAADSGGLGSARGAGARAAGGGCQGGLCACYSALLDMRSRPACMISICHVRQAARCSSPGCSVTQLCRSAASANGCAEHESWREHQAPARSAQSTPPPCPLHFNTTPFNHSIQSPSSSRVLISPSLTAPCCPARPPAPHSPAPPPPNHIIHPLYPPLPSRVLISPSSAVP